MMSPLATLTLLAGIVLTMILVSALFYNMGYKEGRKDGK